MTRAKRIDALVNVDMDEDETAEVAGVASEDVLQIGNGWMTVRSEITRDDVLRYVEAAEEGIDAEVVDAIEEADSE
jgi:hypothetical protein